jgi:hypothetical protein
VVPVEPMFQSAESKRYCRQMTLGRRTKMPRKNKQVDPRIEMLKKCRFHLRIMCPAKGR